MNIWALADLHLAFSVPSKSMDVFGPRWHNYAARIENNWRAVVQPEDLVLVAGDISWAMRLEEALTDLKWIDALPGTKLIIRGNHDYWWNSPTKMRKVMPSSIHLIQNDAFQWGDISIGGARLWDTPEYSFGQFVEVTGEKGLPKPSTTEELEEEGKIFKRELQRLEMSLQAMNPHSAQRIVMTHYPPIGANLKPSAVSALLEKYRVDLCVFGHLHNVRTGALPFGTTNGVRYLLTACDYLDFQPILLDNGGSAKRL